MVTGGEMYELCETQKVDLDRILRGTLLHVTPISSAPTPVLNTIKTFSDRQYEEPGTPLAASLIDRPEEFAADTAARAFIDMVNGSVCPENDDSVAELPELSGGSLATCPAAEFHFQRTIDDLQEIDGSGIMPAGCQIITARGTPVFLRKGDGRGEASSLSLSETLIGGIRYPAGSLLRVETDTDYPLYVPRGKVEVMPVQRVTGARFLRLSAYALTLAERAISFVPHQDFTPSERKNFKETTVEEIGKLASWAVAEISLPYS